jgi:hypothetical protein
MKMEINLQPQRAGGAGIGPKDYVADAHLPRILALLKLNTRQAANKAAEWQVEAELQEKIFVDLDSSSDDDN